MTGEVIAEAAGPLGPRGRPWLIGQPTSNEWLEAIDEGGQAGDGTLDHGPIVEHLSAVGRRR
jgi:hypothetical protein